MNPSSWPTSKLHKLKVFCLPCTLPRVIFPPTSFLQNPDSITIMSPFSYWFSNLFNYLLILPNVTGFLTYFWKCNLFKKSPHFRDESINAPNNSGILIDLNKVEAVNHILTLFLQTQNRFVKQIIYNCFFPYPTALSSLNITY